MTVTDCEARALIKNMHTTYISPIKTGINVLTFFALILLHVKAEAVPVTLLPDTSIHTLDFGADFHPC